MARLWERFEDEIIIDMSREGGCLTISALLDRAPRAIWMRAKKLGIDLPKPDITKSRRFPKVGEKAFIVTSTKWLKCLV